MAPRTRQLASTSATTSTTTSSKTNATSAAPSPQDSAAFIQNCIGILLTTQLPVLAELHPGFKKLLPGQTPKRPMNKFIMFKAWVSKVVGPSAALKAAQIWKHVQTISPRSQIVVHMEGLARQQDQAHKATYPDYVFRPKTKTERKAAEPYTRPALRNAGKVLEIGQDEQPVASGSMPQIVSEETASESGAQEKRFVPYGIPERVQAYAEGSFGLYNIPDNAHLAQEYPCASSNVPDVGNPNNGHEFYPNDIPDVQGYSNQGLEFIHNNIPELAQPAPRFPFNYTHPSPTPSLGTTETPPGPANFEYPLTNLLTTPPIAWDLVNEQVQELDPKGTMLDGRFQTWAEINEWVAHQLVLAESSYTDAPTVGF